eukprot:COSAG05_NODE_3425_length_2075_cov_2.967105_1_plen_43_part_10
MYSERVNGRCAVRGPRIDVDLCVSTYSTLKSSSILGACHNLLS